MIRVYFSESDGRFWLKRFLKPGFSHCFITTQGVLINPCFHWLAVYPDEGLYQCTTYIDVEIEEPEHVKRTVWQVFTCVSVLKSFLGINSYFILTPYQLHQHLMRYCHGKQKQT